MTPFQVTCSQQLPIARNAVFQRVQHVAIKHFEKKKRFDRSLEDPFKQFRYFFSTRAHNTGLVVVQ